MIGLLVVAQLAIVAHAPDTVAACDVVEVTVAVSAPGTTAPQLIAPDFAPFDVLRSSARPHVQLDPRNGGSMVAEYRYVLTTEQSGAFTIPSFEARLGRDVARTHPLRVVVRSGRNGPGVPTVVARARIDTSLEVNFRALTEPETVFVGQQANYEVAVFLNETVRDRLRRNPTFYPPDMQAMLAYDLPQVGGAPPRRKVGMRCFDALVYQRALFPLVAGRFVIPPAQLVYSLPLSASFFSREESHELQTDSTIIVAVDPPASGRPAEFLGAVGNLSIASRLDSNRGRVGDPLLLTVRISGTGNVKLFPPPRMQIPWASLVRSDERVDVDSAARRIRGSKEFDWVLTPKVAGELDLPPIRYGYFNPDTRRYAIAASSGARVTIAPGALAAVDTTHPEVLLALRTAYRGPLSLPPQQGTPFWVLLAIAPVPVLMGRPRRERRSKQPNSPAAALRALAKETAPPRDPSQVRRVFTRALAERLGLSPESFTRAGALARTLRRAGVSTEVANDAERFLRELDAAAYSADGALPADAGTRGNAIYRAVDAEALARSDVRLPSSLLCLLVLALPLGAGALLALQTRSAREDFDRGVTAYHARQFSIARTAFQSAARSEPLAADAWANFGTAAWAASDTAAAVVGWQRALRLEPTAGDARDRLDLVQPNAFGALGYVPPLSPALLLWGAVVAWWCAWGLATVRLFRRETRARIGPRWSYALGAVAILLMLGGLGEDERLAARTLAVVRSTTRLSSDPALAGDTNGNAIVGEVARVLRREGAWTQLELDGGREGWVESGNVAPLERGTIIE